MKKWFFIFLIIVFIINLGFRLFSYRNEFFSKYDANYWKRRYETSQWNAQVGCAEYNAHINPKTCVWDDAWYQSKGRFLKIEKKPESIGDDGLYAYAGWEYIHGKDPTLLNAEMPPLGKYLIGVSILVFNNQNIFSLISGILCLGSLYLLSKKVLKKTFITFFPVFFFSFEPLFYAQLRAPYLDLLYVSFLFFVLYFLIREKYILSCIFLGLMMSTKASLVSFVSVNISVIFYFLINRKYTNLKKFLIAAPISIIIFCLSYIQYFLRGHSLIDFLKVQKWVLAFYMSGAKGAFGSVFVMLITGIWRTWFGQTTRIAEWLPTWPIIFLLTIFLVYTTIKKKLFDQSILLFIWIGIYMIFLLTVPVFPRYFLAIIPFLYILAVKSADILIKKFEL